MNIDDCTCIQVWSVWHAESFYKSLLFKNVYKTVGTRRRFKKVEGSHGPLLVWNKLYPDGRNYIDSDGKIQVESGLLKSVGSCSSLKSKDSMATLRGGGSGAF